MTSEGKNQVARVLDAACSGNRAAAEELWRLVYQDLRVLAASQLRSLSPGQTLQPTALVNEAFLRLVGPDGLSKQAWQSRQHFFGASARAMRDILVDEFRRRSAAKRGGGQRPEQLIDFEGSTGSRPMDVLELDEALRKLETVAARASEVVVLRFFGGLTIEETAEAMGLSAATVEREWAYARAWLYREMGGEAES